MPYIVNDRREELDPGINQVMAALEDQMNRGCAVAGNLNYVISTICSGVLNLGKNYAAINELVGALECAKLELYRRVAANYEDQKASENGDVY